MSLKASIKETPYFDFSTIFKATKSYIDLHNKNHLQLTKRLNANHRATAELIVRLYAKQLNKAIALGEFLNHGLPGFKTFNSSLATCKGCTKRTIMNHKERLKSAGVITKEINCGKSGIELWINPLIFIPKKQSTQPLDSLLLKHENTALFMGEVKNLHPLVHEHQEQENNNSSVDNLITPKHYNSQTEVKWKNTDLTESRQEQDRNTRKSTWASLDKNNTPRKNKTQPPKHLNAAQAAHSTRKSTALGSKNNASPEKALNTESESAFLLQLVKDFWLYTKLILFKDSIFNSIEEAEILNLIWASVYKKFKIDGSKNDWNNYQKLLYKRVDMVAKYLERSPNRWVAPPYLYFDPKNKRNGFDKTYQWFLKQELLKKSIRNQIRLQTVEKEWQDHDKNKGRHKHKTRLQLFRIQQQRLASFNDEQLMRNYENTVQRHFLKPTMR